MKDACEKNDSRLMDYLDGTLDTEAHKAVEDHLAVCAACRAEYEWMKMATADLEALGDTVVAGLPPIDVTRAVMTAVESEQRNQNTSATIPMRQRASAGRRRPLWPLWAGLAAAACVGLGIFIGKLMGPGVSTPADDVSRIALEQPAAPSVPSVTPGTESPGGTEFARTADIPAQVQIDGPTSPRQQNNAEGNDAASQGRTIQLASLTANADRVRERAREIASSASSSLKARVAASRHLPAEEAEPILVAAIEDNPDDAYLRYQLARLYATLPGAEGDADAQFAEMRTLDPDNALPLYMKAEQLLNNGHTDEALRVLEEAIQLDGVNGYSLQDADYQKEALMASGLSEEMASIVAALTAGTGEYDDLTYLAGTLLGYGNQAQQAGSSDEAMALYNAVYEMGAQLGTTALFFEQMMAAMQIQETALNFVGDLYSLLGGFEDTMVQVAQQVDGLRLRVEDLSMTFNSALNDLIGTSNDAQLQEAADTILREGDLSLVSGQPGS